MDNPESTSTPDRDRSADVARYAPTLAKAIAAALFTSGDGRRADRLKFILPCGMAWGGWSEAAAATHIAEIIEAHNARSAGDRENNQPNETDGNSTKQRSRTPGR